MNLLELLHNEKFVITLEKIAKELEEFSEPNADFSNVWPSIIMMLEMILTKHNRSSVTQIIYKKKMIEDLLLYINSSYENKSKLERKLTDYLEEKIIKNKKLNYGNI
jgi:hypothetical protein